MQERNDEEKEPENNEVREVWLDKTPINDMTGTSHEEDNDDTSVEDENKK
jgi:hypothetical protein